MLSPKDSPVRSASVILIMGMVSLALSACGRGSDASCQAPRLDVSPQTLEAGDVLTVTWDGLTVCEGDPVVSTDTQTVTVSIGAFRDVGSVASDIALSPLVADWASMPFPKGSPTGGANSATTLMSVAAPLPTDLAAGQYIVYIGESDIIRSLPFTVTRYERKLWMRDLVMGVAYPPLEH